MFDISFVRKSLSLRHQILNGEAMPDVLTQLEELRSEQPHVFQIETTNACNMTCVMCPRTTLMDRDVGHMKKEDFIAIVDQVSGFSALELEKWDDYVERHGLNGSLATEEDYFYHFICAQCITLHGFGEPLMDNELVERVQYCTNKGLRTYLSANPVNARLGLMERLGKAGLGFIKFHLDGTDNASQMHYRGRVDKTYEDTLQRIIDTRALFKDKGYETTVVLTKLKFNDDSHLDEKFLEFCESHNIFGYVKNQHNRWLYEEPNAVLNTAEYMQRFCDYPWSSMSILKNGDVVPCPFEFNGEAVMGNTRDQSLKGIWNGQKYQEFREMHAEGNFPKGHFCTSKCDMPILYEKLQSRRNQTV